MHKFIINAIRKMSPEKRRAELRALLMAFPDDWLGEAITIAQRVKEQRVAGGLIGFGSKGEPQAVGDWLKLKV